MKNVSWIKANEKFKPDTLVERIVKHSTVKDDKLQSKNFDFHTQISILVGAITFPSEIATHVRHRLVVSSLKEFILTTGNKPEFPDLVTEEIRKYFSTQTQSYHVLTSLSIQDFPPTQFTVDSCRIRFLKGGYPKKYTSRESVLNRVVSPVKITKSYTNVIVEVEAKHPSDGINIAFKALDFLRAILCIHFNSGPGTISSQTKPINRILLGKYHTVHTTDGEVQEDNFWHQPYFYEPTTLYKLKNKGRLDSVRKLIGKISRSKLQGTLRKSLLRYVEALDEVDPNNAIIKLWNAAELMVAPNENNFEVVSRRVSNAFADNKMVFNELEVIRCFRNSCVHEGGESQVAETYCYQLQFFLSRLLLFIAHNDDIFGSTDDLKYFLNLTHDKASLVRKKKLIARAIKLGGKP